MLTMTPQEGQYKINHFYQTHYFLVIVCAKIPNLPSRAGVLKCVTIFIEIILE